MCLRYLFSHSKGIIGYLVILFNDFCVNCCCRTCFGLAFGFLEIENFVLKPVSNTVIAVIGIAIAALWPAIALSEAEFQPGPKILLFKFLSKHHQIDIP